jgi:HSP20 family protein
MAHQQPQTKTVPVRLYQIDDRIMVAAPMPGLEPEDISVTIAGARVTIRGEERGPGQHERDLLLAEWTIGPYYREVSLPQPVNGVLTNATYGNGVLVLVLPKLAHEQPETDVEFRLRAIGTPTHGERIGHSGSTISPTTTGKFLEKWMVTHGECKPGSTF